MSKVDTSSKKTCAKCDHFLRLKDSDQGFCTCKPPQIHPDEKIKVHTYKYFAAVFPVIRDDFKCNKFKTRDEDLPSLIEFSELK